MNTVFCRKLKVIALTGRVYVRPEEKKEKTVYDDEFEKLLAEAEGAGGEDITDGDIDALAGMCMV